MTQSRVNRLSVDPAQMAEGTVSSIRNVLCPAGLLPVTRRRMARKGDERTEGMMNQLEKRLKGRPD